MRQGSSDEVRAVAVEKFVLPALRAGKQQFSVPVKELLRELVAQGFPPGNTPQVCSALGKREFLRENGIEIEGIDGPPSKRSTTVVFHYRAAEGLATNLTARTVRKEKGEPAHEETPDEWAERVTAKIRGLLKDEIAAMGGAEAYMRWVRSDDEAEL